MVEQFHLASWNCFWQCRTPCTAPSVTAIIASGWRLHRSRCRRTRPGMFLQCTRVDVYEALSCDMNLRARRGEAWVRVALEGTAERSWACCVAWAWARS